MNYEFTPYDKLKSLWLDGLRKEGMYRAKTLWQPLYMVARKKVVVLYRQLASTGRSVVVYWGDKSTNFLAVRNNTSWATNWTDPFQGTGVPPCQILPFEQPLSRHFSLLQRKMKNATSLIAWLLSTTRTPAEPTIHRSPTRQTLISHMCVTGGL